MRQLLAREGPPGDWDRQWHRAEDWYFDAAAPRHCFDIIICPDERR
ncbi:hypothetical protein [Paracoccus litorisediminis]|uniref:Uncharacterized protein n=1 Tax=Paracoccus litorisediminis TaxID=2006130 RepID=A0A844HVR6_9RHOB|nr:hypothetical protein [Paracoccus litorisediminis]MTH62415.1 hypothetical protein [Paracoccus litorisediminis]